ncbi:unnamed protein product, partial [marine sediment metagenome]
MRNTFLLLVLSFVFACDGPADKSIFEPLTAEELKTEIDKDTLFEQTYKIVKLKRDSILTDEIAEAKWGELTYRQVYNLLSFASDTAYFGPIQENYKQDWKVKYDPILNEVDSISNHWKKYRDDNLMSQYVAIELVKLDKEYYTYNKAVKNVNLGFKMTPLKGRVEQMTFSYLIKAKLD